MFSDMQMHNCYVSFVAFVFSGTGASIQLQGTVEENVHVYICTRGCIKAFPIRRQNKTNGNENKKTNNNAFLHFISKETRPAKKKQQELRRHDVSVVMQFKAIIIISFHITQKPYHRHLFTDFPRTYVGDCRRQMRSVGSYLASRCKKSTEKNLSLR